MCAKRITILVSAWHLPLTGHALKEISPPRRSESIQDVLSVLGPGPPRTGTYDSKPEGHISYGLHTDDHRLDPGQLFCKD